MQKRFIIADELYREMLDNLLEEHKKNFPSAPNLRSAIKNDFDSQYIAETNYNLYNNTLNQCEKFGLSVRKLEDRLKLGNGSIRRWQTNTPSIDKVKQVANFFKVSIDELVGNEVKKDEKDKSVMTIYILDDILQRQNTVLISDNDERYSETLRELTITEKAMIFTLAKRLSYNNTEALEDDMDVLGLRVEDNLDIKKYNEKKD